MSETIMTILIAGAEALFAPAIYKWLCRKVKRKWVRGVLLLLIVVAIAMVIGTAVSVSSYLLSDRNSGKPDTKTNMTMRDSIGEALDYQLAHHPSSQYRDVYKNFMQDFFGPGHILADTAASGRYLRSELALEEPFCGPLYEKTGFRGNFYRVNLSLIKDGTVPYETFFPAFVESVQGIAPPSGDDWMGIWNVVDSVIAEKGIRFHNEEKDRSDLKAQFAEGNYIAHHSRSFNDSVHFHYRIISRKNFETIILPLIEKRGYTMTDAEITERENLL